MSASRVVTLPLLLFLVAPVAVRADDREKALEILNRGIRAHGGERRLAELKVIKRADAGKMTFLDKEISVKSELTVQYPDKARLESELEPMGQKAVLKLVVNGGKAWRVLGGMTLELGKEQAEDTREEFALVGLTTLLPLREKEVTLTLLPGTKVDGRAARGVKAARAGHGDVSLYFDADNDLLVKVARRAREAGLAVTKEYYFSDFRNYDGVRLPAKRVEVIDGKKFAEVTVSDYKFPTKVDDSTFSKP